MDVFFFVTGSDSSGVVARIFLLQVGSGELLTGQPVRFILVLSFSVDIVQCLPMFMSLQDIYGEDYEGGSSSGGVFPRCFLVRYDIHLLVCAGWCFCFPCVGPWIVDWGWPVRQQASDPHLHGKVAAAGLLAVRSTIQAHVKSLDVALMAFLKSDEASLPERESASSFFLSFPLSWWWRRFESWLIRSAMTEAIGSTSNGLLCNFLFFFPRCHYKGMDVKSIFSII